MQKPMIFNRTLNKKWADHENNLMINKLNNVKAKVNINCPESYYFYQTQFKKTQARNNRYKDNQILFDKIMNILTVNASEEVKKRKPKCVLKKDIYSQAKKYDFIKITQENQYLLKRLNDRNSFYDTNTWEKDYDKSRKYKKNLCVFPSIDFRKTNSNDFKLGNYSNRNKSLYDRINLFNIDDLQSKEENEKTNQDLKCEDNSIKNEKKVSSNSTIINGKVESNKKKILYNKKLFLSELSHCSVTFLIYKKKFTIEVEPVSSHKTYYIFFEDLEEIQKLQKIYKKYDQILTDLDYDFVNDRIYIKTQNENSKSFNNQENIIQKESLSKNDQNYEMMEQLNEIHAKKSSESKIDYYIYSDKENLLIQDKFHKTSEKLPEEKEFVELNSRQSSNYFTKNETKKDLNQDIENEEENQDVNENKKTKEMNKSFDSINFNLNEDDINEENLI